MINFNVTREDQDLIHKIVGRAKAMIEANDLPIKDSLMTMTMDITACHANGCPLKLKELIDANDGDFGRDFFGIRRHINRTTGKIEGGFLPRYADTKAMTESA